MDEYEDISNYTISWDTIPEAVRQAVFKMDVGRVALSLLKEFPDMSVDEACDTANVLLKLYLKSRNHSEEIH